MALVVQKVLSTHTFANFRSIFNANADDAIIVEGAADIVDISGTDTPYLRFSTESGEYFDILLSDFYTKAQVDALIADMRASLLAEFEQLSGTGGGGGGGGSLPTLTANLPDVNYTYGQTVEILLSPNNAASVNGTITGLTVSGLPGWLSFDSETNLIEGTAPTGSTGSYGITVRYTDSIGAYVDDVFFVVVTSDTACVASELIWAGMLVNIYDDGGVSKIRPALGDSVDTVAHAYVDKVVLAGQTVEPRFDRIESYTGLVPGTQYFLSTTVPGGIADEGPDVGTDLIWQPVGVASAAGTLVLNIDMYVLRS